MDSWLNLAITLGDGLKLMSLDRRFCQKGIGMYLNSELIYLECLVDSNRLSRSVSTLPFAPVFDGSEKKYREPSERDLSH